jgi:hypothetical protein
MARALVPLAVLFILAACGSSKQETGKPSFGMRGRGFTVAVPEGWRATRTPSGDIVARSGDALVSVSRFPLRKVYDESQFPAATKTLDQVAARLAKAAGAGIDESETVTVSNRKARAYTYGTRRIGFVLVGRSEYQLYCVQPASDGCALLFSSFTLTGPSA